jgi:hypothetical protein
MNAISPPSNRPRPFIITDPAERDRLLRESIGYAKVSLHHGTDRPGREYAAEALADAYRRGYRLVKVSP